MNRHNNPVHPVTGQGDERKMQGEALRSVMETALAEQQMSVSALAREASIGRSDIYRWWRGEQRPSRNTLARIAAAVPIDIDLLRQALGEPPRREQTDAVLAAIDALGERLEARLRAVEAELGSLRARPAGEGSRGRSAPRGTTG